MENPIEELQRIVDAGSQTEAAKSLGISPQYLSDVLLGRRAPGKKILAALGLQRRMVYERVSKKRRTAEA
jgi:DNA-binding transcriptional regulator YdaS (Cro superfamily)